MGKKPDISVLTAVYNGERYIGEAIESVLSQTYDDFEYLIVDNGSTDGTAGILKRYAQRDGRIKVLREERRGPAHARNAGLRVAQGDWVAVLDADDIALPDRLTAQLGYVRQNRDVRLLGSGCMVIDKDGAFIKECRYPRDHVPLIDGLENIADFFPTSSAFICRESMNALHGYCERFSPSEDRELCLRFSLHDRGKFACIDRPLIKLRKHAAGISETRQSTRPIVQGVAAVVCHFCRKSAFADPSAADDMTWHDFLGWLEGRLTERGIFRKIDGMGVLRDIWYARSSGFVYRLSRIAYQALVNDSAREVLMHGLYPRNMAQELAAESRSAFV